MYAFQEGIEGRGLRWGFRQAFLHLLQSVERNLRSRWFTGLGECAIAPSRRRAASCIGFILHCVLCSLLLTVTGLRRGIVTLYLCVSHSYVRFCQALVSGD